MKKLALSLLAATLFFAACSKDEDNTNPSPLNGITYNGAFTGTPYGYLFHEGNTGRQIAFADKDLSVAGYAGPATYVGISFDTTELISTTYTYLRSGAAGYDNKKNFAVGFVYYKQPFANGNFTEEAEKGRLDSLISGTLTVNKIEKVYTLTYELKYKDVTVKGQFSDSVRVVEP